MKIVTTIDELRRERRALKGRVAFVPTMGFLHEGHRELMRRGREAADHLVVSIFVNPRQFEPGADLDAYPRDPEGDRAVCEAEGCELLYMPDRDEMYPRGYTTVVAVGELGENLCGSRRPGHFEGVTTVVTKLFHQVSPDVAVFGQKDRQQLAIVRRMVRDLDFPIEIVGVPTVREPDGLALSSRNRYLTDDERARAVWLSRGLVAAHQAYSEGERGSEALVEVAREVVAGAGGDIDYVECVDPDTLRPFEETAGPAAVMALAVRIGSARLIDNLRLDEPLPEELRR